MDLISIMWFIVAIIVILIGISAYLFYRKEKQKTCPDYDAIWLGVLVIIAAIVICLVLNLWAYNDAVGLPYEYRADIKNIEEMELYLMRYENTSGKEFGNIGQGLESLKYKQQLQDAIRDKNERYACICGWLNNALLPYKDVIISGLPPGIYGKIVVSE